VWLPYKDLDDRTWQANLLDVLDKLQVNSVQPAPSRTS